MPEKKRLFSPSGANVLFVDIQIILRFWYSIIQVDGMIIIESLV